MAYPVGKKQTPESIAKRVNSRKGYRHSEETRKKISRANKGKIYSPETIFKDGHTSYNKGKKLSEEHKRKISESQAGRKGYWFGKKFSRRTRKKLSIIHRGSKHWNWKGGISNNLERINTFEWNEIRKKVYRRDNYTCQVCGKKNPRPMQCHHIVPYRITQDDSMENLITLCCRCHTREEHRYYEVKYGNN